MVRFCDSATNPACRRPPSALQALGLWGPIFSRKQRTWESDTPQTSSSQDQHLRLVFSVINYSSLWPDLVSNSPNFEMYVGGLFCFGFAFFADLQANGEVLFSVQKPQHFIFLSFRFFFF